MLSLFFVTKTHALHELQTECFPRLLKNREHTKMELLLHFYMRLSTFPDTHPYIVRVPGMLDDLIDMLDTGRKSKSAPGNAIAAPSSLTMLALLTIRNVAFAKETKAFFLNDENFIGTLFRVLEQPNAGEEVLAAATACLWVLLYDNQKVIGAHVESCSVLQSRT